MAIHVGISGFGRMSRLFLRAVSLESLAGLAGNSFEVVHINE